LATWNWQSDHACVVHCVIISNLRTGGRGRQSLVAGPGQSRTEDQPS